MQEIMRLNVIRSSLGFSSGLSLGSLCEEACSQMVPPLQHRQNNHHARMLFSNNEATLRLPDMLSWRSRQTSRSQQATTETKIEPKSRPKPFSDCVDLSWTGPFLLLRPLQAGSAIHQEDP